MERISRVRAIWGIGLFTLLLLLYSMKLFDRKSDSD